MSVDFVDNEIDYTGCHGHRGTYTDLDIWLGDFIETSLEDEVENPDERWVACIWGIPGIGKTTKVKQYRTTKVTWQGQEFDGWDIRDVPVAQFEEMGDIHGLPDKHIYVTKAEEDRVAGEEAGYWVSCEPDVIDGWKSCGWTVDHKKGTRTMYAPPDFVPTTPGPAIIIFDDANRTSQRILKGLMQVFQTHGTVSWKLPPGCVIVLTGNPGMQDYMVTELDDAILQRMVHFTLIHDAKQWVLWAAANDLDPRGISYIVRYPEMLIGPKRTSPRSLAKFFRFLKRIPNLSSHENIMRAKMFAKGVLDDETVASILTFMERDVELVVEPEQILAGEDWIPAHMEKLYKGVKNPNTGEVDKRIDIISVTVDRLYAHMARPSFKMTDGMREHFQSFATSKWLEEDARHNMCMRLFDKGGMQHWLLGSDELTDLVMEIV